MAWNITSPVTGAAVIGLINPTYTLAVDSAPNQWAKQHAVTALGGTQTGVDVHSVSKPFTIAFFRPQTPKGLPQANPVTGVIKAVPRNVYKVVVRKGALPAANQVPQQILITCSVDVPAGVDTYEPEDLKAACSLAFGAIWQQASGIADTTVSGIA